MFNRSRRAWSRIRAGRRGLGVISCRVRSAVPARWQVGRSGAVRVLTPPVGGSSRMNAGGTNQSAAMASHAESTWRPSIGRMYPCTIARSPPEKGMWARSSRASTRSKWETRPASIETHFSIGGITNGDGSLHSTPARGTTNVIRLVNTVRSPWITSTTTVDIDRPRRTSLAQTVAGPTAPVRRKLVVCVRTARSPPASFSAARTAIAHMYPPCTPTSEDQPASRFAENEPGCPSSTVRFVVISKCRSFGLSFVIQPMLAG